MHYKQKLLTKYSIWLACTNIFDDLLSFESDCSNVNHRPVTRMD
ncbi:hypothetical protein HMPREF9535_03644 [Escherichia coli MS 78-1]|nr:hypothetical protein HMPREF9535_03644 [Escherichia coli MS 78-1]